MVSFKTTFYALSHTYDLANTRAAYATLHRGTPEHLHFQSQQV